MKLCFLLQQIISKFLLLALVLKLQIVFRLLFQDYDTVCKGYFYPNSIPIFFNFRQGNKIGSIFFPRDK